MANIIRNEHALTTLRMSLKRDRTSARVVFTLKKGAETLKAYSSDAAEVGIAPEIEVSAYRNREFTLPTGFADSMQGPLVQATGGGQGPLWLQIDRSAGFLALVPWERLLLDTHPSWMLRVPNFAVRPRFTMGPLRSLVCASSPLAKTEFDVAGLVSAEVDALQNALPASEIHVFGDGQAYPSLARLRQEDLEADHRVLVHEPPGQDQFGRGGSIATLGATPEIASPWLLWIQHALEGRTIDYCHFITQGYFRDSHGALALAGEPALNHDSRWSHFVALEELHRFLTILGAWSVGFTQPADDVWALGLRLLADEVAWERPGPVLVHDATRTASHDLEQTYRFLFHPAGDAPVASPGLSVYAHPLRLPEHRELDELVIEFVQDDDAVQVMTPLEPSIEIEELSRRIVASSSPQWEASAQRLFDDAVSKVARSGGGSRAGGEEALRFIAGLFDGG